MEHAIGGDTFDFGPWRLERDAALTRATYARITEGSSDGCRCDACRQYAATRATLYPPEVATIMQELGIDVTREREVSEFGFAEPPGEYIYLAEYDFAGRILAGPDALLPNGCSPPGGTDLRKLLPGVSVGFSMHGRQQRQAEFAALPAVTTLMLMLAVPIVVPEQR